MVADGSSSSASAKQQSSAARTRTASVLSNGTIHAQCFCLKRQPSEYVSECERSSIGAALAVEMLHVGGSPAHNANDRFDVSLV